LLLSLLLGQHLGLKALQAGGHLKAAISHARSGDMAACQLDIGGARDALGAVPPP